MSSNSSLKKKRLYFEIKENGILAKTPYDRCFQLGCPYVVIDSQKRLKCAECVRQGKPYVNLSQASLDRTRKKLRKEINADKEELTRVIARLIRNKKILKQADNKARKKAECLANKLEESGDLNTLVNCPTTDTQVGLSPIVWSSLNFIDESIGFDYTLPVPRYTDKGVAGPS